MAAAGERVVRTTSGDVAGIAAGTTDAWLGVPYAAPPVGPLRFRAPEPVSAWDGVRRADRTGGAALQTRGIGGGRRRRGAASEDCLYLNVHAPAAARADGRLRPVLVWIHGGGYTVGSGALYPGAQLAAEGDLVVVTLNYRLGVFGFVDLAAALDVDVPSNLGLRDQVAALRWLQDNLPAFGGDPDQVTVAGESAGAVSVSMLMTMPPTRGLFRAAVLQSGCYSLTHGPQVRTEVARYYARELGLGRHDGRRLWQIPAEELLRAQAAVDEGTPGTTAAAPWFDGDLVPGSLDEARRATRPDVALLAGHNRDEITLFQRHPRGHTLPLRRHELAGRLRAALGGDEAAGILAAYPATAAGTTALGSDLSFAMPTLHLAERHVAVGGRAWFYRFDARVPVLGATHGSELVYLWGWRGYEALLLRGRATPGRTALAGRMRRHWLSFVRDGTPGADWPAFDLAARSTRIFDPDGDRVEDDPSRARRMVWAGQDVLPRA